MVGLLARSGRRPDECRRAFLRSLRNAVAKVYTLYQAWTAEKDPAKCRELAMQLVEMVIHEHDKQETDIADEVTRDGRSKHELALGSPARMIVQATAEVVLARW